MKFLKNLGLLILIASSRNNFAIVRELPFFDRINLSEVKNHSLKTEAFCSLSTPESKREDGVSNDYLDFSGTKLSLNRLQKSTNAYRNSVGLENVVYLNSVNKVVALFLNHDSLDVFMDTKTQGARLSYARKFKSPYLKYIQDSKHFEKFSGILDHTSVVGGFTIPVMHVSRDAIYQPRASVRRIYPSEESEILASGQIVSMMKRMVGPDLDLNTWSESGCGNLTLFLGQTFDREAFKKMKNLSAGAMLMLELPTSRKRDEDNVLSFSFGMPTVSVGLNLFADLKLRYGLSVGGDAQVIFPWSYTSVRRISLANEPNQFSPYKDTFVTTPGMQTAFAPYIQWTFYRDISFDVKLSFVSVSQDQEKVMHYGADRGLDVIARLINKNDEPDLNGSSWNAKYWNLCLRTGTNLKIAPWISRPELCVSYDFPWSRRDMAPNHRLGIYLKFDI